MFGFQYTLLIKITKFTYKSGSPRISFVRLSRCKSKRFATLRHRNTISPRRKLSDTERGRALVWVAEGVTVCDAESDAEDVIVCDAESDAEGVIVCDDG